MRTFSLSVVEPSEPAAGAILIVDQDNNDIAEFYHSEHSTVGQSYVEALALAEAFAAMSVIPPRSRNVSAQSSGTGIHSIGNSFPREGNQATTLGEQTEVDPDFLRDRQQDDELRAADCTTTKDWEQWARERREYEEPYGAIGGRY